MFKFFVKMDGVSVAINPAWVVSVLPAIAEGQPCVLINGADKCYWYVRGSLADVVSSLNRE